LADEAVAKGWREAVASRFAGNRNMLISVLDWQRASWLPLLALPKDAVALDIGSGYGAITHSLSHAAAKVYSIEAIPERLEFTRIRMEQEGIRNVQLVQGSALELPLRCEGFDAIVVNGVLEWVGDWRTDKDPRTVQLHFLRSLHKLLKPEGVLVIGIENRFSYDMICGGVDHSGLPYTSLMPRSMASVRLRYSRREHHRTFLKPRHEYRTYTYSERGYWKLLAESGFASDFYWAHPGYNEPCSLVPLENRFIADQVLSNISQPFVIARGGWRHWLKRAAAATGLLRLLVPDFLIFAVKNTAREYTVGSDFCKKVNQAEVSAPSLSGLNACLSTSNFASKNVIRICPPGLSVPQLIVKTSTPAVGSENDLRDEHAKLSLVFNRLRELQPCFSVPRPLGSFEVGNFWCVTESAAKGESLARLLYSRNQRRQFAFLRWILPRCAEVAIQLAGILRGESAIREVDTAWRQAPVELLSGSNRRFPSIASGEDWWPGNYADWVQHGDFTFENVFLELGNRTLSLIDWQHLVRGVPPLYDSLSLLFSLLPAIPAEDPSADPAESQFLAAFFSKGRWASLFRDVLRSVCAGLGISESVVWRMFVEFLVLRIHYYASRDLENRVQIGLLTQMGEAVNDGILVSNVTYWMPRDVMSAKPMAPVVTGLTWFYARYLQLATQHSDRFLLPPLDASRRVS